jgi:hypothetical protein
MDASSFYLLVPFLVVAFTNALVSVDFYVLDSFVSLLVAHRCTLLLPMNTTDVNGMLMTLG